MVSAESRSVCSCHAPSINDVIIMMSWYREAVIIVDEFRQCLAELDQEEAVPLVPVELMDPNVARIYSKAKRGQVSGE